MSSRVAWQVVGGEVIVLDVSTGRAIGLSEVGAFVWTNLDKLDTEQMVEEMIKEFEVDEATARNDLAIFLETFVRDELLQVDV
jgi:Coenzyme PQQ synthesis protein D (PqqD)